MAKDPGPHKKGESTAPGKSGDKSAEGRSAAPPPARPPPEELYTPERMQQWLSGQISMQQLHAVHQGEMLEIAVLGYQLFENGKYDEARTIFEGLNALDHKESYYLTALGAVHLAQDNLGPAEQCLNAAIELNPKDIASYVNRGEVYLRLGKVLDAAQDFKRAVDLDPTGKDHNAKPLLQRARGLAAAALEAIEAAGGASSNEERPSKRGKALHKSGGKPAPKSSPSNKPGASKAAVTKKK